MTPTTPITSQKPIGPRLRFGRSSRSNRTGSSAAGPWAPIRVRLLLRMAVSIILGKGMAMPDGAAREASLGCGA